MNVKCPTCAAFIRLTEGQRQHSPAPSGFITVRVIGRHYYGGDPGLGRCDLEGGIITPDQYAQFEWQA